MSVRWDRILNYDKMQTALARSEVRRSEKTVYPSRDNVFLAFRLTPYETVKVLILGQDPYPGVDRDGVPHAHGLAFSSKSEVEVPASLKNIFKEVESSVGEKRTRSDLTDWAKQGVLLLNSVLTVDAGDSGSHINRGWELFTLDLIKSLCSASTPLVCMLWGNDAKKFQAPFLKRENVLVLTSVHPSPLSAHNGFFGCNHFKLANDFLVSHGLTPICWGD